MAMAAQEAENEVHIEEHEKEEEEVKWVNHYSSSQQILLVGEGDFSFSLCLALAFGSASNICASSLDTYGTVIKNYKNARSNLDTLQKMGASVIHGVDATRMNYHPDLRVRKFDRIVFNFPHAGFLGKEDNHLVIGMHRKLVNGFFKNASRMLRANGEVHVSHKTTGPFRSWNLEELANKNSLLLTNAVDFKIKDYPSYNNKRGGGCRCDEPFRLGKCSTFKFRFSHAAKKRSRAVNVNGFLDRRSLQRPGVPIVIQKQQETSFDSRHCDLHMNEFPGHVRLPLAMNYQRESPRMSSGYLSNVSEMLESLRMFSSPLSNVSETSFDSRYCDMRMNEMPGPMELPLAMNFQRESPRMFSGHLSNVSETFRRATNDVDYIIHEPLRFESLGHPQRNLTRNINDLPGCMGLPLTGDIQRERLMIIEGCFNNVREIHGREGDHVSYSVHGSRFPCFERRTEEAPGRTLNGDLYVRNELQRLNTLRMMVRNYGDHF